MSVSDWAQLLGGGVLLYFGAAWFVGGASALALALRVPQLLIGLTVVAYGTSAPEIVVGAQAAITGHGELALGNVVGSNITNIGLILGVAALIRPARVDESLRRRELPMLLLTTALVPLVLVDGLVMRWEGAALILVAVGYTVWMIRAARAASVVATARREAAEATAAADAAGAPKVIGTARAVVTALAGLCTMLIGGNIFITGAISIASHLGMSDRLVGLTVVAVGTSLPELVTSVVAARRGHSDLAVGNVVGSNIFNVLLCLGASALAGVVAAPISSLAFDLGALVVMTGLAALYIRTERLITRVEGAVAVTLYGVFMLVVIARG